MTVNQIFDQFHAIATNPSGQMKRYLEQGKKVVLCAPLYTPDEIIHALGAVPFGVWGADIELKEAKRYFPAFLCSIVQSLVELGIQGAYDGASALVLPSLCDTLKVTGENWKYAVPSIPFIPMVYPQNRMSTAGVAFVKASYLRVANDLERILDTTLDEDALEESIEIYNRHNEAMRCVDVLMAQHPEITAVQRSDVYKSAFFMLKEEHTQLVEQLIELLKEEPVPNLQKAPIFITGILADSPDLNRIIDELGFHIVGDDVAAQSRRYWTDAPDAENAWDRLAGKFMDMGPCSVLYDPKKTRRFVVPEMAKERNAKGIVFIMTKFCDPEEFDYPLVRQGCENADLNVAQIEVDRQMNNYAQARTILETFRDVME